MNISHEEIMELLEDDRKEIGRQSLDYDRAFFRAIKALLRKLEEVDEPV